MCWCQTCRAPEGRWSHDWNTQFILTLVGYGELKGNHNCINGSTWMQALKNHKIHCKLSKCNSAAHFWIFLQKRPFQVGKCICFEKHPSLQPDEDEKSMVFVPIVQSAQQRVGRKLRWRLGQRRARRQWRRSKRYKTWILSQKSKLTQAYASMCYATKAILCRRTNGSCWRLARHQADLAAMLMDRHSSYFS